MTTQPSIDPCEREYTLNCLVCKISQSFLATKANGDRVQQEDESIILIPEESSQRDAFFAAWLPDFDLRDENPVLQPLDKMSELILNIAYPIGAYSRAGVIRSSQWCDKPHLFIQTKGVEQDLMLCVGQKLVVTTQDSRKEYDLSVMQKDYDLPFSKVGFKNEGAADHVNIMPGV